MFKIGYSSDQVEKRVRTIQSMSPLPLVLVAAKQGDRSEEAALHRRFGKFRVNGEWFDIYNNDQAVHELLEVFTFEELQVEADLDLSARQSPAWLVLAWCELYKLAKVVR